MFVFANLLNYESVLFVLSQLIKKKTKKQTNVSRMIVRKEFKWARKR